MIDFGKGIGTDYHGCAILEPFARAKQDASGTGLGLAIVEQFAAVQAARLSIEETPGGGTTVALAFPG